MTTTKLAYWLNGTAYCPQCVESETSPCMSQAERDRATISEGIGACGCCGEMFGDRRDEMTTAENGRATRDELLNLKRLGDRDDSQGDIAGCNISFEFAGRKWEYRCRYDRYWLYEVVDGRNVLTAPNRQPDADAQRLLESTPLLDRLARTPELVEDRTGYHKGDTAL